LEWRIQDELEDLALVKGTIEMESDEDGRGEGHERDPEQD
jgi:hypothetical protein